MVKIPSLAEEQASLWLLSIFLFPICRAHCGIMAGFGCFSPMNLQVHWQEEMFYRSFEIRELVEVGDLDWKITLKFTFCDFIDEIWSILKSMIRVLEKSIEQVCITYIESNRILVLTTLSIITTRRDEARWKNEVLVLILSMEKKGGNRRRELKKKRLL